VSHDLRSPLRAIDGFSLMLLEDYGAQLDAEAHRYLTTIRAGTQRMGQLIDDLLAFSRIGRQPLKDMPVDMEKLAHDAAAFAVREGSGTAPRIVVSSLPAARGDPSLLQQVWQNLIGNAVKYSSKVSTPLVEVTARQEGDEVVYSVRDNGAGFDMQFAHKLFGVFQRLHGQDEFPGTGVGLAIVHRIITRHSGRIWAESVSGHGATFQFAVRRAITA
jgi:light-regulated signal transduction histidine kinase (bacteriophytochrome)